MVDEPVVGFLPSASGLAQPLGRAQVGKLRGTEPAQDVGALLERARRRQFSDARLETDEPLRIDHRPDIVENDAGNHAGPHRPEPHREDPAARGTDEYGTIDL